MEHTHEKSCCERYRDSHRYKRYWFPAVVKKHLKFFLLPPWLYEYPVSSWACSMGCHCFGRETMKDCVLAVCWSTFSQIASRWKLVLLSYRLVSHRKENNLQLHGIGSHFGRSQMIETRFLSLYVADIYCNILSIECYNH